MSPNVSSCPDEEELLRLTDADSDEPVADLRSHVDACPACRRRLGDLETALRNVQAASSTSPFGSAAVAPFVSPRVGKYLILGPLGQGGQANVFRALHPTLGREVVIKLSRRPLELQPGQRDRLAEEARLLQELNHPSLGTGVLDLDYEAGPDGLRTFLVLDYVRGQVLTQLVREQGPLKGDRAARWLIPLARALAAAHRRGILHLDVKPDNVLIDDRDAPHLIDFGIALLRDAWEAVADVPGGTAEFMAPEQVRGDATRVDGRADVYGLGGVLFFLLTSQTPRHARNRIELLEQARRGDVDLAPLTDRRIPRALADVCRRALAPEPADRFASATAFAAALERYLRLPRRRAVLLLAGSGLTAAALLGWSQWPRPLAPGASQDLITDVRRGERVQDLRAALPLTTGDRFRVRCEVPRGAQTVLFYLDSEGQLSNPEDVRHETGDTFDRLVYPDRELAELQGPPGVEMLLVAAGANRPTIAEVRELLGEMAAWPQITPNVAVLFGADGVHLVKATGTSREMRRVDADALAQMEDRVEVLRRRLRPRFSFFAGVVYRVAES